MDFEREWLETNGLGGFASSTVCGRNTRRYHGLLVAALHPPVGRYVLLSKLEETLLVGGKRFELSTNQYPGVVHPTGHRYLRDFRADPHPTFVFSAGGVEVTKSVYLVDGENTVVVEYELASKSAESCRLEIRPLIAFRDYHSTTHRNNALNPAVEFSAGVASIQPYASLPRLYITHNAGHAEATGQWYENFEYERERERGLDFREDLFNPLLLVFSGSRATITASTERHTSGRRERRPAASKLAAAADQFIVKRGEGKTIIAGYHWFSDWGRDTMIALPGLTLVTGRFDVARDILRTFARSVDRGMLPNRFPDAGETPEYNTVDATLWFFEAVRAYLAYTGDTGFVHGEVTPVLADILDWHIKGTRYGIHLDHDGLLACGEPGVQLTWMDAKIGEWVVTPRSGKPVEIQALWYNALRVAEDLLPGQGYGEMADRARANFLPLFWNAAEACLYDVVDGGFRDGAIRPNQIFAVSLPHPLVRGDRARQVVDAVQRDLLTPAGLRSLSPRDSRYRGRYEGGVFERDSAYHQGTVWPWLLGPFLTAYAKTHRDDGKVRECLDGFEAWGHISEIADGDAPHAPRGCIAQAWTVGELLRASAECYR